jgi:hypothetical protein
METFPVTPESGIHTGGLRQPRLVAECLFRYGRL